MSGGAGVGMRWGGRCSLALVQGCVRPQGHTCVSTRLRENARVLACGDAHAWVCRGYVCTQGVALGARVCATPRHSALPAALEYTLEADKDQHPPRVRFLGTHSATYRGIFPMPKTRCESKELLLLVSVCERTCVCAHVSAHVCACTAGCSTRGTGAGGPARGKWGEGWRSLEGLGNSRKRDGNPSIHPFLHPSFPPSIPLSLL